MLCSFSKIENRGMSDNHACGMHTCILHMNEHIYIIDTAIINDTMPMEIEYTLYEYMNNITSMNGKIMPRMEGMTCLMTRA